MADRFSTHAAVFVQIMNEAGEILLQQRSNTGFLDGYWDMPSGHIEPNEAVLNAAIRELYEEVCLSVKEDNLQLVHINQNFLDMAYLNFTFKAAKWTGTPTIGEPNLSSGLKFYALDALPEKCSLAVRVLEKAKFSNQLSYSVVQHDNFEDYMLTPFDKDNWGKS